MMLKRYGLASLLLCVVLHGTGFRSSSAATRAAFDGEAGQLISEGLGIRGVYVWRSTADDVIAAYGKDYELVKHGIYNYELRYALLDLSFWYCQDDPRKRIFDIECRTGFAGFTAKGIVLGKSTMRDVFEAYGPQNRWGSISSDGLVTFEYPGIEFSVVERKGELHADVNKFLDRKIVAIDVITSQAGSDCVPPNLK